MAKKENSPVIVKVKTDGGDVKKDLHLYLFDDQEQLLESTELKNGEAKLKTAADQIRGRSQIIIGPAMPKEFKGRTISPILIKKMGGYQPSIQLDPNNQINIIGLPKFVFPNWAWCLITGNLSKSFTIDGESKILPVCEARVHICEIDRIHWWWPKIPRPVIIDLGKKLKEIVLNSEIIVPPLPDPGPRRAIAPPIGRTAEKTMSLGRSISVELPDDVKRGILSDSETIVHDTIFNNFQLLHPYICLWPWFWPYFYHCDEIATVQADCNGRFNYHYLNFTNDKDIYVWVEVNIRGSWVTVYRPHIACNTYWNYECGKDINIRITDSRVRPCECAPLPGSQIWLRSINGGVTIRSIQQNEAAGGHLSNAVGLTWHTYGGNTTRVSPFGMKFPFVLQFGSGFPAAGGATHYRWSYRKLKDAFLTNVFDTPHPVELAINKPYRYDAAGGLFATGLFPMGATYDAGKPKYKIPHVLASNDVADPGAVYYTQDTNSIDIDTIVPSIIGNGLYEFIFELLDNTGNVIPVAASTYLVDRLSSELPGPVTIHAEGLVENYLVKNLAGDAIAFKFKMRIDNQKCYADVLDALVDGSPTDAECGIGHYNNKTTDNAVLNFIAGHEQDFAYYSFDVTKGNSNDVPTANSDGYVGQLNNGYVHPSAAPPLPILVPGIPAKHQYKKEIAVSTMLGTCDMAAFAEVLNVHATHTNGDRRIHEFDKGDVAAIAMATP